MGCFQGRLEGARGKIAPGPQKQNSVLEWKKFSAHFAHRGLGFLTLPQGLKNPSAAMVIWHINLVEHHSIIILLRCALTLALYLCTCCSGDVSQKHHDDRKETTLCLFTSIFALQWNPDIKNPGYNELPCITN